MSRIEAPEPALPYDGDPRAYAAVLAGLHESRMFGSRPVARPRHLVDESWSRMERDGVPVHRPDPHIDEGALEAELDAMSTRYGADGREVRRQVKRALEGCLLDSDLVGIFATPSCRVGDRYGSPGALRRADRIGFVHAAAWGESAVGTNAIGLAGLLTRPVQVHGPEHWCVNQHDWSCAAAPVRDPADGAVVAVVDISGGIELAHPALLGLVQAVATQAELRLRDAHRARLEKLRKRTWSAVSRLRGPWALTDEWGWVVGAQGLDVDERVELTGAPGGGLAVVAGLGQVEISRIGEAVVLVPRTGSGVDLGYRLDAAAGTLTVTMGDLRAGTGLVTSGGVGATVHHLTGRHIALLTTLARARGPLTPTRLAESVWGTQASVVTARAEVSRLRRRFPGLVSAAPYRLLAHLDGVDAGPVSQR